MSCLTQSSDKTNGRWTKQQHQNFLLGLQMYGKNWKKIEELIGTRNGSQIRSHAQKFFLKVKKTYSTEENSADQIEQVQVDTETYNSKPSLEIETKITNYSYFLGKMQAFDQFSVQYSTSQGPFDFWNSLIDHQESRSPSIDQNLSSRKNSIEESEDEQNQIDKLSFPEKKIKLQRIQFRLY